MIDLDDDRLELVLVSIGEHLATVTTDAAGAVDGDGAPRRRTRPGSRRLLVGLAVAAVTILAAVLAIAPVRSAVAGWLGLGSTRIVIDPTIESSSPAGSSGPSPTATTRPTTSAGPATTPTLQAIAAGLTEIDARTAEDLLRRPLPPLDDTSLGAPAGYRAMPEGGVLVVWPDGTTLWIHRSRIDGDELLSKLVAADEAVQDVDGLGDAALAVIGGHVLRTPQRTIPAETTVLWLTDDLEWRLESDRPVDDVIELARSIAAT